MERRRLLHHRSVLEYPIYTQPGLISNQPYIRAPQDIPNSRQRTRRVADLTREKPICTSCTCAGDPSNLMNREDRGRPEEAPSVVVNPSQRA